MGTNRVEAFSDGVMAVAITIMVLELKAPEGIAAQDLWVLAPKFLTYVLSFLYVGIYWNNHHHLMAAAERVNGTVLWANLHLLFWLSLIPFTTAWMGTHPTAAWPMAAYGSVLMMAAMAWAVLQGAIIRLQGDGSAVARAVGSDVKGKLSAGLYLAGVALAWWVPLASAALYAGVALMWLVPDRRFEGVLGEEATKP
ncbi:MAG TPA: TMEM175 family protein [Flavobacteriales bacterium]|nr:TMEM175 family protein [Flavobacteriales bacterium]